MKALDSLKEDIKDETRSLETIKHSLYEELKYMEANFFEWDAHKILNYVKRFEVKANHIMDITVLIWLMEKYLVLFEEEQKLDDDFNFNKWKKETFENEKYLDDEEYIE